MQIKNIWGGALFATRTDTGGQPLARRARLCSRTVQATSTLLRRWSQSIFQFLFFIPRGTRDGMFSHPRKLYEDTVDTAVKPYKPPRFACKMLGSLSLIILSLQTKTPNASFNTGGRHLLLREGRV